MSAARQRQLCQYGPEAWEQAMAKIKLYVDVLPSEPVPAGTYLVHNHVRPVAPLGLNSFRAWIQTKAEKSGGMLLRLWRLQECQAAQAPLSSGAGRVDTQG